MSTLTAHTLERRDGAPAGRAARALEEAASLGRRTGLLLPDGRGDLVWEPAGAALLERLLGWTREVLEGAGFSPCLSSPSRLGALPRELVSAQLAAFAARPRGPRELPWRRYELGAVGRPEDEVCPPFRGAALRRDEASAVVPAEELGQELARALGAQVRFHAPFGWALRLELRGAAPGCEAPAGVAEAALRQAAAASGLEWLENPGQAPLEGPCLELFALDAWGRAWQLGRVGVDLSPAARALQVREGGPLAVVRLGLLGGLERLAGVLLEHLGGAWPAWLAPEQVRVLAVGPEQREAAARAVEALRAAGVRATLDSADPRGPLSRRLAEAAGDRPPYLGVVGAEEAARGGLALRARGGGQVGWLPLEVAAGRILAEAAARARGPELTTTPTEAYAPPAAMGSATSAPLDPTTLNRRNGH